MIRERTGITFTHNKSVTYICVNIGELAQQQVMKKSARTVRTARLVATAAAAPTAISLNKTTTQVGIHKGYKG